MNKDVIIFENGIPKKNNLLIGLMFLKIPLLLSPIRRFIVNSFKKSSPSIEIIPGFMSFYSNIYAENNVVLNNTHVLDYAPVYIGENTRFSFENMIITSEHDRDNFNRVIAKPVHIGKNVWVTSRCIILSGVTIGDNVVIGAGSVVVNNIPSNCFAAGNPAKPIKYYKK